MTLRFFDGQAHLEASAEHPYPVREYQKQALLVDPVRKSATTTAVKLADANENRKSIKVTNVTGTEAVYIGRSAATANVAAGDYLAAGAGSYVVYTTQGELWAIVNATTQSLAVAEEVWE